MKILNSEQMRCAEQECERQGIPAGILMESAGRAVAEQINSVCNGVKGRKVVVLVGPGNNGGDGLVTARYLLVQGAQVTVCLFAARKPDDVNLKLVEETSIKVIDVAQGNTDWSSVFEQADIVVDALFGTGKIRTLGGLYKEGLEKLSRAKEKRPGMLIFAVDLPSGLDADTGAVDPVCPSVDYTITLGFPKLGLFNIPGAERAGKIRIVDIGIPETLAETVSTGLITEAIVGRMLPRRPVTANKGTFGRVIAVAGSVNYTGAAYLACAGAMRSGAGLVTLAIAKSLQPVLAAKLTETTFLPLAESEPGIVAASSAGVVMDQINGYNALLAGCGLGRNDCTKQFLTSLLFNKQFNLPAVLDADALNIISEVREWLNRIHNNIIVTPHPGEMSRLTGIKIEKIQSDRLGTATRYAAEWKKVVVLKGAYTVVASPDGRVMVSPFASAGLASAGTGDVLSGVIAGMLAQGLDVFEAAVAGVFLHGKAGEMAEKIYGDAGALAGDLLPFLPQAIKSIKEKNLCC